MLYIVAFIVLAIISLPIALILLLYSLHLYKCFKLRHIPGPAQFLPPDLAQYLTKWIDYEFAEPNKILTPKRIVELEQKYKSKTFKIIIMHVGLVIFSDPEFLKYMAGKGHKVLRKDIGIPVELGEMFGPNVFSEPNEEEWKRHRQVLNQAFTPDSFARVLQATVSEVEERLYPLIDKQKERDSFEDMSRFTIDIIGRAGFYHDFDAFNKSKNTNDIDFPKVVEEWSELQPGYGMLPQWLRLKKDGMMKRIWQLNDIYKSIIEKILVQRKSELEEPDRPHNDLLSLIMKSAKDDISEAEVVANGIVFFFAGHETTAKALGFALYSLASNPEKLRALQDSLESLEKITWEDYESGKLEYAEAVIKETLRRYSPAIGVTRAPNRTIEWNGMKIEKGTFCVPCWGGLHVHPDYWKKPLEFVPERFVHGHKLEEKQVPFTYAPFGNGLRSCIGKKFAEIEAAVALALLAKRYNVILKDPNYEMDELTVFALRPRVNPILVYEKR